MIDSIGLGSIMRRAASGCVSDGVSTNYYMLLYNTCSIALRNGPAGNSLAASVSGGRIHEVIVKIIWMCTWLVSIWTERNCQLRNMLSMLTLYSKLVNNPVIDAYLFSYFGWKMVEYLRKGQRWSEAVQMLRTPSPIDRHSCDPCPLLSVAGRNQNVNFLVCKSDGA